MFPRFAVLFRVEGIFRKHIHNLLTTHHKSVVKDETLAQKLLPDFDIGCKRITPSNEYLQCFNKETVTLVTEDVQRITADGIETKDGTLHKVDTIIYATGFSIMDSAKSFKSYGIDKSQNNLKQEKPHGKVIENGVYRGSEVVHGRISLAEEWDDQPNAYKGITYPDHPNYFILLGPGTGLGHNSGIYMIECQMNYVVDAINKMIKYKIKSLNLKKHVNDEYQTWVQKCMKNKVFGLSTCISWYKNARGVVYTLWPSHLTHYWWVTRKVNLNEYICNY